MGVEVEIKAHVDAPEGVIARLEEIGSFRRRYIKEDRYFGRSRDPKRSRFRLRRDGERWVCTYKQKTLVDRVEQNREVEFDVSDGDAFTSLAEELGFFVAVEKRKEGSEWTVDGIIVEVSNVFSLGHFVELELILQDESDPEELAAARRRLFALLERIGIPASRIETRPYTQMIYENRTITGQTAGASL
ncbi:MAG: class IV adenylate cyclase [Alkalispirochaeta sp.]